MEVCGSYYTSDKKLQFHVAFPETENMVVESDDKEDQSRIKMTWSTKVRKTTDYHVVREGDHLMVLFESDLCVLTS